MKHIHESVPNKIELSHFSATDGKERLQYLIGIPPKSKTWISQAETTGCVMSNSPLEFQLLKHL